VIEKFAVLLIQELGPTGLLILAFAYIFDYNIKKLNNHQTEIINELKEIKSILDGKN